MRDLISRSIGAARAATVRAVVTVLLAALVAAGCGGGSVPAGGSGGAGPDAVSGGSEGAAGGGASAAAGERGSADVGGAEPAARGDDAPPVRYAVADCSASFLPEVPEYLDELGDFVAQAAAERAVVRYGCFAGRALTDRRLRTEDFSDGGEIARAAAGREPIRERLSAARASAAVVRLRALLEEPHPRGSDPLGLLERASRADGLDRIAIWSDFVVIDGDVDLRRVSAAQVDRIARRWIERIGRRGLAGVHVVAIGIGRGAGSNALARTARELVRTVVHGCGGTFSGGDSLREAIA